MINNFIHKPPRLFAGDTIGIAAPAGSFKEESLFSGIDILKSLGFQIYLPDGLFEKKGYLAGSDEHRAEQLNRLFADSLIKAIFCARGGFGSIRTLPLLNYDVFRDNPKILLGFSDISALLWSIYTVCGCVTFHGPLVTMLSKSTQQTTDAMFSAVSSGTALEFDLENGITIIKGMATAPVCGGNLCTLCHLLGTRFSPAFKGHILFIEDLGEPTYKIDRMLTQMKLAGCFDGIAGLVLGAFEDCGLTEDIFRIVRNIFRENPIPILAGFDAGHGKENLTIPFGIQATLDADRHRLIFNEPATEEK